MAAKKKEIAEVTPSISEFAGGQKIEKVYMPLKTKQTQMLGNGDAKAGAVGIRGKVKERSKGLLIFFASLRLCGRTGFPQSRKDAKED